jgi:threonine/homoserine/homoserine lactone efflux protein
MEQLKALIVGLVVGFVLAIPPGPIGFAVVKHAVERKNRAAAELAGGAATMDTVYATAATFASSTVVAALGESLTRHRWIALVFQIACVAVLVVLGARYWRGAPDAAPASERAFAVEQAQEARAKKLGVANPFLFGMFVAITNVASPTFLPSLVFLTGFLTTAGWLPLDTGSRLLFALGFGLGTFGWFLALLRALMAMKDKLAARISVRVQRFAGGAFIAFAAILAAKVVASAEWAR